MSPYGIMTHILVWVHSALAFSGGAASGLRWALTIIVVSLLIRAVLLPFNLRQFHAQIAMQKAQPVMAQLKVQQKRKMELLTKGPANAGLRQQKIRELKAAQRLETMEAMQGEGLKTSHVFVPMAAQFVLSILLYHVIGLLTPSAGAHYGISAGIFQSGGRASVLGAPLASHLTSSAQSIHALSGSVVASRLGGAVIVVLAVAFSTLSVILATRRQPVTEKVLARAGESSEEAMARMQGNMQVLLRKYGPVVIPLFLLLTYSYLPLGLLLNILVISGWTFVFQQVMQRRHPQVGVAGPASVAGVGKASKRVEKVHSPDVEAITAGLAEVAERGEELLEKVGVKKSESFEHGSQAPRPGARPASRGATRKKKR